MIYNISVDIFNKQESHILYISKGDIKLRKKGVVILAILFTLLIVMVFIVPNKSFEQKQNAEQKKVVTYTVKANKADSYRGIYKSKGYIDLQNINNNHLLVKDGDYVYYGEKLTSDGNYAQMNGIFSKGDSGDKIFQNDGELVFNVPENAYKNLEIGDGVRVSSMNSQNDEGQGTIVEIGKQPIGNNDSSISKYRVAVQVQNPEKYFFGEHLVVSPISKNTYVPNKYVSPNNSLIVHSKKGNWETKVITPISEDNNGKLYSVNDLPIGTEVKQK